MECPNARSYFNAGEQVQKECTVGWSMLSPPSIKHIPERIHDQQQPVLAILFEQDY